MKQVQVRPPKETLTILQSEKDSDVPQIDSKDKDEDAEMGQEGE